MPDQEIPGAGAVLLAAYLGADAATLAQVFGPILSRFPFLTGAMLWNVVKLLCEEDKSVAETATVTGIDVLAVELIKRSIKTMEALSRAEE